MEPLRVVFMGTAELACPSLAALAARPEYKLVAVVTQPDKPKGRGLEVQPSPVKRLARELELELLQPEKARDPAFIAALETLAPELIIVAAYGQILPEAILRIPRHGCLNVHASLLPKYRGAAPIQWAILNDETETGVTIMKIDAGLDTGDIVAQRATPIHPHDTAQTLHDRLARMGAELLVEVLPDYLAGKIQPRPQPKEGATYAPKIQKEHGKIDWTQPARKVWNQVRGLVPWPGAFTYLRTGAGHALLKIWRAEVVPDASGAPGAVLNVSKSGIDVACGRDALRILELQLQDRRKMTAQEFIAGHQLRQGDVLE
ncbi:MAG: methionyl-tRNA formyltransferase [Verrucomicrobiae bacterium]|nr:methionyl-tRNA formyltransferase [Verrucomicrobiae bacterium]MCX7721538.1 methionyl-tRNA formyltransferase [Verrucomicrobiae bacterium]